jgi:hypothetical protein
MANRQLHRPKKKPRPSEMSGYGWRSPLISRNTPRIIVAQAAKEMGIDAETLKKVFSSRVETGNFKRYGKKGVSVLLNFDFGRKEVVMEGGISTFARIARPDVETLGKYFLLREQIRKRELIPVSEALRSRNKEPKERMQKFIRSYIALPPEADPPKVIFSKKLPRLGATVRKMGKVVYCEPRHGDALVFASILRKGSEYMCNRLMNKTMRELDSFRTHREIPFEFGMKLWIVHALFAERPPALFFHLRDFELHPVAMQFWASSQRDYLERITPGMANY